ncbi:MAG TPA: Fe-Mn family superoxide dismutase [Rhabdochlamydiaceae bacterium]|nr:Fe-Mn family superoxide dismutase [Rhabdochlamydiaceae bacterium]
MQKLLKITLILAIGLVHFTGEAQMVPPPQSKASKEDSGVLEPKDYSRLLGMSGFNDSLLKMHFTLYQGYVKNTNLLLSVLKNISPSDQTQFGALKRRLAWEFNGVILHELYFENLGGKTILSSTDPLAQALVKSFGSVDAWKKDFIGTGMMRGIGWAVLYLDPITKRLTNLWINEHDLGHLAGGTPILIMDVFEHAYMPQYGLDRDKYIDAFFQNIDWVTVSKRFTNVSSNSGPKGSK